MCATEHAGLSLFLTGGQGLRREMLTLWFTGQWKVPGWSVTRQAATMHFSQWVSMKSCEGTPCCQVSVQNSDSEVCHHRNTSSLFFPPHRAKQKQHTLVSNFIYPITIAHVYTIKSVWLPKRELTVTAGNEKENSSECSAQPRKGSIQEREALQPALK